MTVKPKRSNIETPGFYNGVMAGAQRKAHMVDRNTDDHPARKKEK